MIEDAAGNGSTLLPQDRLLAIRGLALQPSREVDADLMSVAKDRFGGVIREIEPALHAYSQSLHIAKQLAARAPSNAAWQRDLAVSCMRVAQTMPAERSADAGEAFQRGIGIMIELANAGRLPPPDIALLERILAQLQGPEDGS